MKPLPTAARGPLAVLDVEFARAEPLPGEAFDSPLKLESPHVQLLPGAVLGPLAAVDAESLRAKPLPTVALGPLAAADAEFTRAEPLPVAVFGPLYTTTEYFINGNGREWAEIDGFG